MQLCEAMQRIPGNHGFNAVPRIEFTTTVRHYYGRYAYYVFQVLYTVSLQALNVASMIISAQVRCLWPSWFGVVVVVMKSLFGEVVYSLPASGS